VPQWMQKAILLAWRDLSNSVIQNVVVSSGSKVAVCSVLYVAVICQQSPASV
jgi:hypothetical protein